MSSTYLAKGRFWRKVRSAVFLLPAWFSPHTILRVFFHRLRGVRIGRGVEVGYFCILGNVDPPSITIEDKATISAGAVLLEHDNAYHYSRGGPVRVGPVRIGRAAFVGVHAIVFPGVAVGTRAIIAAGSVVTRSVPAETVVGGVPAVRISNPEPKP